MDAGGWIVLLHFPHSRGADEHCSWRITPRPEDSQRIDRECCAANPPYNLSDLRPYSNYLTVFVKPQIARCR